MKQPMHSIRVAYRIRCEDLCTGSWEIYQWLQHHWGAWLPFLPVTKDPHQEGTHGSPSASVPKLSVDFIKMITFTENIRVLWLCHAKKAPFPNTHPLPSAYDVSTLLSQCFLSLEKDNINILFNKQSLIFNIGPLYLKLFTIFI